MSSSEGEGAEHGAEHGRTTSPAPGARGRLAAENGPGASSLRGSPRPRVCRRLGRPVEAPLTCLHAACWSPHRRRSPCSRSGGRPGISWHFWGLFFVFTSSEPPGTSLPRARAGWSEPLPPTHGDPSRGRPRGERAPSAQSGRRSLDVVTCSFCGLSSRSPCS